MASVTCINVSRKDIDKHTNSIMEVTQNHITESSITLPPEKVEIKTFSAIMETDSETCYDDVYITPNFIQFNEAAEGFTSCKNIIIQNRGAKPAFIKIREPNAIAFQIKPLRAGTMLSPGLSISASVMYTFRRPSLLRAIIPIEINNKILDYYVICTLATERIKIQPSSIDFETVDLGYMSESKFITIINEGGKSTRFSIDLANNDFDIIVKPLRGIVRPYQMVNLKVEMMATKEGVSFSEFWIKSTPNIRVPLKVNVILHRLTIYHPNTTGEFTLVDFPPTVKNTLKYDSFVLRNISSRACNYIVLGEINNELKSIRAATKSVQNIDYRKYPAYGAFEINPIEGHIGPFEGIIFNIGFRPTMKLLKWREILYRQQDVEYNKMKNTENDFMAFIRIIKMHCAKVLNNEGDNNLMETCIDESVHEKVHMQETFLDLSSTSTSSSLMASVNDNDTVRLCLYGEMEVVKLNVQPDILYFGDLYVGETSQRVFCISNLSSIVPVTFQCVPVAAVKFYPKHAKLKPKGSIEILVKVQARENVGPSFVILVNATVDSEDPALTKQPMKVKIDTLRVTCMVNVFLKTKKPRPCNVEFTKNIVPFDSDKKKREKIILFSDKYLKRINETFEDDNAKIISRLTRIPKQYKELPRILACDELFKTETSISEILAEVLIPLTPLQIYNVHVYPDMIDFGMVALKIPTYRQLIAENRNEFSIEVQFISSLRNVQFPDGDRMILHPKKTMITLIEFYGNSMGKFNGFITYNINGNHCSELSVTAEIVHKDLSLDKREIIIGDDYLEDESYRPQWSIVQIRNKLDAATRFKWTVSTSSCFSVEPKFGTVLGNNTLNAFVSYDADPAKVPFAEMTMKCESGTYSTLRCNLSPIVPKVIFINDQIDLGELSLNLPSKVNGILQNSEYIEMIYEIDSSSLIDGCEINPMKGKIPPRGIAILETSFKFDVCIDFMITICVIVQKNMRLQWKIKGLVPFPRLKFIPQSIEQRRVIVNTFQSHLITVTNVGTTASKLRFDLQEYPEFSVLIIPSKNIVVEEEKSVIIPAGSSQSFHLQFRPLDPASYAFYLPVIINDILGPVLQNDIKTLKPREYLASREKLYKEISGITFLDLPAKLPFISIDFTVAGHIALFNKFEFNFDTSTDDISDELKIKNPNTSKVTFIIQTKNFKEDNCPFSISWSRGTQPIITPTSIISSLLRGEEIVFVLKFKPKYRGTFQLKAPICIQNDTKEVPLNTIHFYGIYPEKSIETDVSEIYLQPIPLNTPIEATFKLKARHFEYGANILYNILPLDRCCGEFKKEMLNIVFPSRKTIVTESCIELDVMITFQSKEMVSFCCKIEFYDEQDHVACPVMVHGTADNNLLTTYTYLGASIGFRQQFMSFDRKVSMSVTEEKLSITEYEINEYNYDDNNSRHNSIAQSQTISSNQDTSVYKSKLCNVKSLTYNFNMEKLKNVEICNEEIEGEEMVKERTTDLKYLSTFLNKIPAENHRLSIEIMYPYFPEDEENMNDYGRYMHRALSCAEQWLYSSILKYSFYPNVLDGITASFSIMDQTNSTRSSTIQRKNRSGKSFVDALESLIGSSIYDHVEKLVTLPQEDVQRIDVILRQYEQILDFLFQRGACLTHVTAYFLLNYHDYVIFVDPTQFASWKKKWESYDFTKLSKPLFESRSKQCWLDLILQTYKCFKLNYINEIELRRKLTIVSTGSSRRSTVHRDSMFSTASIRRMSDFYDKSIEGVIDLVHERMEESDRPIGEIILLSWLYYHYEEQRTKNWLADKKISNLQKEDNLPCRKSIDNFSLVLSDSLVLIAVTGSYCPFLIDECFSNLYINPKSMEEALHNATCLVSAWIKIRLGFMITPLQIVQPNRVQMLMLVTHLFEVLPSYIPKYKITFDCPLTETVVKQITFSNTTDDSVDYLLLFINNGNGFFSLMNAQQRIRINAHDVLHIKICFHAKKIKKTKAYLLLCGAAYGPHFGKTQTYTLEGNVSSLEVSQECVIRTKLYQILDTTLSIKIPYENVAEYEIWIAEEQPNKLVNLRMTKWSELRKRAVPRRLFLNQKIISVYEGVKEATLAITIACITPNTKKFWLVCQSKTGDFIIQITSRCQPSLIDDIIVQWNEEHEERECICTDTQEFDPDCPYTVDIFIPSRNTKLWNCINHMFQKTLDSKERSFWSKYLDTYIGLKLIHWLMEYNADSAALEFMHIFDARVTYTVSTSEENLISVPDTLVINDVRLKNAYVPMAVHFCTNNTEVEKTTLSLVSEDGKELRLYTLNVLHSERQVKFINYLLYSHFFGILINVRGQG